MGIFDLFSKRQKRLRGEVPDIYRYDDIPEPLRVQIVHIWRDSLGNPNEYYDEYLGVKGAYKFIVEALCREYGVFCLVDKNHYEDRHYMEELFNFFLREKDTEKVLDTIELSLRFLDRVGRGAITGKREIRLRLWMLPFVSLTIGLKSTA